MREEQEKATDGDGVQREVEVLCCAEGAQAWHLPHLE